ncbi:nuclear transport factor 2 family protein [Sphingomonas sp. PAMC 26621]|uniref:nuclear transport factor 2 family protein n=1 Tax=Sphingomonas sp. PAMC 26621 TaxID=1112213 RepID=UPI00028A2F0E|nr:nuclear transport factor 2 family protein [Sphingomonas sp. PAMC 26621]
MTEEIATGLLEASIERVWNEHDGEKRIAAIAALYHPEARIYEPERSITGHAAISDTVACVLADMPPGFRFEVTGPTLGHHGVAVTRWKGGPPGQVIVSGADTVHILDGKIHEHWFFFDPPQPR